MRLRYALPAIGAVSAVALMGGLLATTLLVESQTGIDEDTHLEPSVGPVGSFPPTIAPEDLPPDSPERKWRTENDSPDFEGELLGIYLGNPATMQNKDRIPNVKDLCPGGFETVAGHPFAPPEPPYLPPGAEEQNTVQSLGGEDPSPGARVCKEDGRPYTGWRSFLMPPAANPSDPEFRPSMFLHSVQETTPFRGIDASAGRVQVVTLAGREMVSIAPVVSDPASPENFGELIVPTDYGYLVIVSNGVDFTDVLKVGESLAPILQPRIAPASSTGMSSP